MSCPERPRSPNARCGRLTSRVQGPVYVKARLRMSRTHNDILLIDDDPCHAKAFEEALIASGDAPSNFEWVRTLSSGLERLAHKGVWAIFINLFLPDSRGLRTLDSLRSVTSNTPVIVLGGVDDEDICKTAMLHGAQDYLLEGHLVLQR